VYHYKVLYFYIFAVFVQYYNYFLHIMVLCIRILCSMIILSDYFNAALMAVVLNERERVLFILFVILFWLYLFYCY